MLLLGLDVGTTGAKAAVFDENGEMVGYGFEEYGVICDESGLAEQNGEQVWESVKRVILSASAGNGEKIAALSLSVQGDAVLPIDRDFNPLMNVQLGMDYRGGAQVKQAEKRMGGRRLFVMTGMRPHPMNSLIKILWIKDRRPEIFEKTWKFVTYSEFILGKLGAETPMIDLTMATRTMAMDLVKLEWSETICSELGVKKELLSIPVASGTVVGKIRRQLAEELGLNHHMLLVAGAHDQVCAAVGAGVVLPGKALDSHGTAEVISTVLENSRTDDKMYSSYFPCYAFADKSKYFTFSLNHTAGILYQWFIEGFCGSDRTAAEESGERLYEYVLKKTKDAPSSMIVLPYFNGSGTPECDLDAKGMIAGLTLTANRYDIARAIMESLAYSMRENIERMREIGIPIEKLHCVGGGARSPIGLQMKADILGLPVQTLKIREAACLGAAVLAGIGTGKYSGVEDAQGLVRMGTAYYPRKEMLALYDEKYRQYQELYQINRDLLHRIK